MADTLDTIVSVDYPGWRARVVSDPRPSEPWGDALAPALITGRWQPARFAAEVFIPPKRNDILHGFGYFNEPTRFERYLRIVHATTSLVTIDSADLRVLVFDTASYREHIGYTGPLPIDLAAEHAEWRAYLDADVYGVLIEQRHTGVTAWDDGHSEPVERWQLVDSLFGICGLDRAHDIAHEELAATAS